MFSVSITHHSKIRELSDWNKNWKQSYENPNGFLSHGFHHFWVMSYGNWKSKQPLTHVLISCDSALSVWSLWQDYPIQLLLNVNDFTSLVHQICSSSSAKHLEFFFAISWSIWYNRNLLVHNERGFSPLQILDMARSVVEDFQEAILVKLPPEQPSNGSLVALPPGFFKVNVDGSSSLDGLGTSRVGVIIHDEEGRVVATISKALPLHYPADWTELFAIKQGVLLAQEMTLSNVIFESDVLLVI